MQRTQRRPSAAEIQRRVLTRVKADVDLYGQSVMFVGGSHDQPGFIYTIGRACRGLPELLITLPIQPEVAKAALNELDREMPLVLPSGSLVYLAGAPCPVKLLDADDRAKRYTFAATEFHGGADKYRVQQVLLCDPQGHFPPDCAKPYDMQPILGELTTSIH